MRSADDLVEEARLSIDRVSAERAFELAAAGALLIDIRPAAQRAAHGGVPGALIIERNVLEWRLDPTGEFRLPEVTDHARKLIVLCQQGYASSLAAASLAALGYTRPADVIGGFDAWAKAGLPVLPDAQINA
ncbi:MAG TPA: rhodanese-like domain-containing protein [Polyangiales bacterium]|nr:rhodanese-like domain-containing protein [Polyangiales bacterium]